MTDRPTASTITDTQLDELYATLEFTEAALARMRDRLEVTVVRIRRFVTAAADTTAAGISDYDIGRHDLAHAVLAALDEPAPGPATTPATDDYERTTGHEITCTAGFTNTCDCTPTEPDSILDPDWLRQQYAAVIRRWWDADDNGANEIATAVLRVRDRHLDQLRQRLALADTELQQWAATESADAAAGSYAHRAETAEQQRDQYADALRRAHATIRQQHATITRIRNLDRTPPQVDPDSSTGRAYTAGWQAALDRVTTELVDTPKETQ
jgi:hypothetical protein